MEINSLLPSKTAGQIQVLMFIKDCPSKWLNQTLIMVALAREVELQNLLEKT